MIASKISVALAFFFPYGSQCLGVTLTADSIRPSATKNVTAFVKDVEIKGNLVLKNAKNQEVFSVKNPPTNAPMINTSIGGELDVRARTKTRGLDIIHDLQANKASHHIIDVANLTSFDSKVLDITFDLLAGKGALVKLGCLVTGTISAVASVNYYEGVLFVLPGATTSASCELEVISETTTNIAGTAATINGVISGLGRSAILKLTSDKTISSLSIDAFYDIMSSNIR